MKAWIYQLSRKSPEFFEEPGDITKTKLLEMFLQTPVHTWGIRNYFRDALPGDPLLFKIGAPEALGVVGIATIEKSGPAVYRELAPQNWTGP